MLGEHLVYVSDARRLRRFEEALSRLLKPRVVAADLGCGSGVLGLLCLEAGAGRIVAVDSTGMIEVARDTLTRAGWGDRCVFIRGCSLRVDLPEPVDLVVCDHVGYFGFDYGIVHTLQDARRRFLKPGGRVIPSRIRLQVGAVECEKAREKADGWQAEQVPSDFHWLRHYAVNAKHPVDLPREALLSGAADLGEIDLNAENPDFFRWSASLTIGRDGVLHGLAGWFQCELAEGVWMTNSPLSDEAIQRPQTFLPIEEPVAVRTGDRVDVSVMARPAEHLIAWVVELPASGRRFSHSTWQGLLLSSEDIMRSLPNRVPRLSREGEARHIILGYCDGRRTAREIELAVLQDHPELFPSPHEVSRFVAQVLGQDTEVSADPNAGR